MSRNAACSGGTSRSGQRKLQKCTCAPPITARSIHAAYMNSKTKNGKLTYKIFASADDLKSYLRKNKNKTVRTLPQRRPLKSAGRIIHESATSSAIMSVKPTAKNMTPVSECLPTDISGISSSTNYEIGRASCRERV